MLLSKAAEFLLYRHQVASFCDQVPVVGGRAGSMVRAGPVGSGQTVRAAALELLVQGGRSGGALLLHQLHHDRLHSLGGLEIQKVAVSGRIKTWLQARSSPIV